MNRYKFIYLFWLLPIYFLGMGLYQAAVYYGMGATYENGDSYTASVTDFDIKQIAAQTNGYVVLKFTTKSDEVVEQKLSLPVQLASQIMDIQIIPIRYQKGAFQDIVMMPTYRTHREMILMNLGIVAFALVITIGIALIAHRYANRKLQDGDDQELNIERVDLEPTS